MCYKIQQYFNVIKEPIYISYELKKEYTVTINQEYRHLILKNEDSFVVYSSFSEKSGSYKIEKRVFFCEETAKFFVIENINRFIHRNIFIFILG